MLTSREWWKLSPEPEDRPKGSRTPGGEAPRDEDEVRDRRGERREESVEDSKEETGAAGP